MLYLLVTATARNVKFFPIILPILTCKYFFEKTSKNVSESGCWLNTWCSVQSVQSAKSGNSAELSELQTT